MRKYAADDKLIKYNFIFTILLVVISSVVILLVGIVWVVNLKDKCMVKEQNVVVGIYQHSDGDLYEVLTVAQHTKNKVDLVIYTKEGSTDKPYARPLKEFLLKCKLIESYDD